MTEPPAADAASDPGPYRVLARKYRPTSFEALIGQEALVRTLTNAFRSGRLAHAYMLSGVRGIGKTTTARIIARALNCIGPDGTGGRTATPSAVCEHCREIVSRVVAAERPVVMFTRRASSITELVYPQDGRLKRAVSIGGGYCLGEVLVDLSSARALRGGHNAENAAAAFLACEWLGVPTVRQPLTKTVCPD